MKNSVEIVTPAGALPALGLVLAILPVVMRGFEGHTLFFSPLRITPGGGLSGPVPPLGTQSTESDVFFGSPEGADYRLNPWQVPNILWRSLSSVLAISHQGLSRPFFARFMARTVEASRTLEIVDGHSFLQGNHITAGNGIETESIGFARSLETVGQSIGESVEQMRLALIILATAAFVVSNKTLTAETIKQIKDTLRNVVGCSRVTDEEFSLRFDRLAAKLAQSENGVATPFLGFKTLYSLYRESMDTLLYNPKRFATFFGRISPLLVGKVARCETRWGGFEFGLSESWGETLGTSQSFNTDESYDSALLNVFFNTIGGSIEGSASAVGHPEEGPLVALDAKGNSVHSLGDSIQEDGRRFLLQLFAGGFRPVFKLLITLARSGSLPVGCGSILTELGTETVEDPRGFKQDEGGRDFVSRAEHQSFVLPTREAVELLPQVYPHSVEYVAIAAAHGEDIFKTLNLANLEAAQSKVLRSKIRPRAKARVVVN